MVHVPYKGNGPVTVKLLKEVLSSLKDKELIDKVHAQGFDLVGSTPAQFRTHIQNEAAKWKGVVKKGNISAD